VKAPCHEEGFCLYFSSCGLKSDGKNFLENRATPAKTPKFPGAGENASVEPGDNGRKYSPVVGNVTSRRGENTVKTQRFSLRRRHG